MTTEKKDRRIYLGMPGYGKQTSAAGRGFWRACADFSHVGWNHYQAGSLLGANFNQLWCGALNLVHKGERLDYFAMLHDDIGPEDCWLDKLIDELEANELDVLGVAVPIKDTRGMTSMALHREGDNWLPLCRLSMHDVYELPETFTSDSLPGKLLLNTGCWVAKWNQEWAKTVHFEINDRIVFNTKAGRYQAQTEPEDWHFSRQLHEIGQPGSATAHLKPLRIGATRKIAVMHQGEIEFTNDHAWGSHAFDKEATPCSPVKGAFPREIAGWLLPAEGKALAELARGKRVLEIGSYCGLSTVCMARTAKHVTAMDYFDGRGTPRPQDTRETLLANLKRYGVQDRVQTCHPESAELPLDEYDLVFIDGAHDFESVQADTQKALAVLAPDGLLAFHDYGHPSHPGIKEVVELLLGYGHELLSTTETVAVVKPPARIPLEV